MRGGTKLTWTLVVATLLLAWLAPCSSSQGVDGQHGCTVRPPATEWQKQGLRHLQGRHAAPGNPGAARLAPGARHGAVALGMSTVQAWTAGRTANASGSIGRTGPAPLARGARRLAQTCASSPDAWAPSHMGNSMHLVVLYATPVYAISVSIHENWRSSFVKKVQLVDTQLVALTVWEGNDTTPCGGWLNVSFTATAAAIKAVNVTVVGDGSQEVDQVLLSGIPVAAPAASPAPSPAVAPYAAPYEHYTQWPMIASASCSDTLHPAKYLQQAPGLTQCGGSNRAWRPCSTPPAFHTITLTYAAPVYATRVDVLETAVAGIVNKVELRNAQGMFQVVWQDLDLTACNGWLNASFPLRTYLTSQVRVTVAQYIGIEELAGVALTGWGVSPYRSPTPSPPPSPAAPTPSTPATLQSLSMAYLSLHLNGTCDMLSPMDATKQAWITSMLADSLAQSDPNHAGVLAVSSIIADMDDAGNCLVTVILRANTDVQLLTAATQTPTLEAALQAYFPGTSLDVAGGWEEQLTGWSGDGDKVPPQIILLPPETITLSLYQTYQEPGAFAVDNLDTFVRVVINAPVIDTKKATTVPYQIAYDAADFNGNKGATVYRYVHVVSPCLPTESYCPEISQCSVLGECSVLLTPFSKAMHNNTEAGQPDTKPPVITLLGVTSNTTTVGGVQGYATYIQQGEVYFDPGATAQDPEDGDVSDSILVQGVSSISTDRPTTSHPYLVTYDVQDLSGNWATSQHRWVHVVCAGGESVCVSDEQTFCSVAGVCSAPPQTTDHDGLLTNVTVPSIKLIGPGLVTIVKGAIYNACPAGLSAAYNCDRGVIAVDASGRSLAANVTACADKALPNTPTAFRVVGLLNCLLNTNKAGRYNITFSVSNSQGIAATAVRTVVVQESCATGESPCPDGSCSAGGSCVGASSVASTAASPTNSPPNITLIMPSSYQEQTVYIKQGTSYLPCKDVPAGFVLGPGQPCEPGATALDEEDGNLTSSVLACPPESCMATGCPGHEFRLKGLRGCGIDTTAPVGTAYQLKFVVFDNWSPMASAVTNRTIVIISPCASGEVLCQGSCIKVDCSVQIQLQQAHESAPGPAIVLLPWEQDAAAGLNRSIHFFAGVSTGISLLPCLSLELATSSCGAVAKDRKGNDVSSNITVDDMNYCADGQCWSCYPELLSMGSCPPGVYLLRYSAMDAVGGKSSLFLTVVVDFLLEATLQFTATVQADASTAEAAAVNLLQNATAAAPFAEAYLPYFTIPASSVHLVNIRSSSISQNATATRMDVTMHIQVNGSQYSNGTRNNASVRRRLQSRDVSSMAADSLLSMSHDRSRLQGPGFSRRLSQSSSSCYATVAPSAQLTGFTTYGIFRDLITISSPVPTCLVLVGSEEDAMLARTFAGLATLQFMHNAVVSNVSKAAADAGDMLTMLSADGGSYSPTLLYEARQYLAIYPAQLQTMAKQLAAASTSTISGRDFVEDLYPIHPTYSMHMSHQAAIADLDVDGDLRCFTNRSSTIRYQFNFTHSWSGSSRNAAGLSRRLQGMAATGQSAATSAESISNDTSAATAARTAMALMTKKYKSAVAVESGDPTLTHYLFPKSRVVGGLLMHMVHSKRRTHDTTARILCQHLDGTDSLCNNLFPLSQTFNANANTTGAGFGQDPAFFTLSPMFDPLTANNPQEWYNNSADIGKEVPYGFLHQPVPGLPEGFPVWVGNEMPARYVARVLQYMKDGAFLSAPDTNVLTLAMATMNRDLSVIFFWKGVFDWRSDGSIALKVVFQSLPAVDWRQVAGAVKLLYADILLVVLVAGYWVITAFSVMRYCVRWLLDVWKHGHSSYQLSRYNKALTPFWAAYEILLCALMLASVLVKYIYSFVMSPRLRMQHRYPVYDNPGVFTTTRPMLLKRVPVDWPTYYPLLDSANSKYAEEFPTPAAPDVGDAGRWLLPPDDRGLTAVGNTIADLDWLATLQVAYMFLQVCILSMLIARLIEGTAFQAKLGIIAKAIRKTMPEFAHFMGATFLVSVMFAVLFTLLHGDNKEVLSSSGSAIQFFVQYVITGQDDSHVLSLDDGMRMRLPIEEFTAGLVHTVGRLFLIFVIFPLVVGMIAGPVVLLNYASRSQPSVVQDFVDRVRWWDQIEFQAAPSNKDLIAALNRTLQARSRSGKPLQRLWRSTRKVTPFTSSLAAARKAAGTSNAGGLVIQVNGDTMALHQLAELLDNLAGQHGVPADPGTMLLESKAALHPVLALFQRLKQSFLARVKLSKATEPRDPHRTVPKAAARLFAKLSHVPGATPPGATTAAGPASNPTAPQVDVSEMSLLQLSAIHRARTLDRAPSQMDLRANSQSFVAGRMASMSFSSKSFSSKTLSGQRSLPGQQSLGKQHSLAKQQSGQPVAEGVEQEAGAGPDAAEPEAGAGPDAAEPEAGAGPDAAEPEAGPSGSWAMRKRRATAPVVANASVEQLAEQEPSGIGLGAGLSRPSRRTAGARPSRTAAQGSRGALLTVVTAQLNRQAIPMLDMPGTGDEGDGPAAAPGQVPRLPNSISATADDLYRAAATAVVALQPVSAQVSAVNLPQELETLLETSAPPTTAEAALPASPSAEPASTGHSFESDPVRPSTWVPVAQAMEQPLFDLPDATAGLPGTTASSAAPPPASSSRPTSAGRELPSYATTSQGSGPDNKGSSQLIAPVVPSASTDRAGESGTHHAVASSSQVALSRHESLLASSHPASFPTSSRPASLPTSSRPASFPTSSRPANQAAVPEARDLIPASFSSLQDKARHQEMVPAAERMTSCASDIPLGAGHRATAQPSTSGWPALVRSSKGTLAQSAASGAVAQLQSQISDVLAELHGPAFVAGAIGRDGRPSLTHTHQQGYAGLLATVLYLLELARQAAAHLKELQGGIDDMNEGLQKLLKLLKGMELPPALSNKLQSLLRPSMTAQDWDAISRSYQKALQMLDAAQREHTLHVMQQGAGDLTAGTRHQPRAPGHGFHRRRLSSTDAVHDSGGQQEPDSHSHQSWGSHGHSAQHKHASAARGGARASRLARHAVPASPGGAATKRLGGKLRNQRLLAVSDALARALQAPAAQAPVAPSPKVDKRRQSQADSVQNAQETAASLKGLLSSLHARKPDPSKPLPAAASAAGAPPADPEPASHSKLLTPAMLGALARMPLDAQPAQPKAPGKRLHAPRAAREPAGAAAPSTGTPVPATTEPLRQPASAPQADQPRSSPTLHSSSSADGQDTGSLVQLLQASARAGAAARGKGRAIAKSPGPNRAELPDSSP